MRTTPATNSEADAWIAVLLKYGHLHHAQPGPEGAWTVRRTSTSTPRTLHHPVLVLDYVADVLCDVRGKPSELPR
ncbi:hypothetical protein ACTWJ8_31930 [Streptomyces sp. SDT5-1]|uniref:hypothetical protein n=1 Tax=Streptomyces sp. SDT5-1 TaxID=3406418 RepID=UPI003FD1C006